MSYDNIIVEKDGAIGTVKINRPNVLNAVNVETILEIEQAIKALDEDKEAQVAIITGEGKSFISGSDIARLADMDKAKAREYSLIGHRVLNTIENSEMIFIAAVNGFALGSGCELAMACDIRLASEKAKFGQPEVKLGLIPGHAGTQRLSRIVGAAKAKELIFTGDIIDAQTALSIGLVNKVVPPDALIEEAKNLARKIIENGPAAVKAAKRVINRGIDVDFNTAIGFETEDFSGLFGSAEASEGMKAFLEKRKPEW